MMPIVFINCSKYPFIDEIMNGSKKFETRTRDTLSRFWGERVLIAETGKGHSLVRCSAVIGPTYMVTDRKDWDDRFRKDACIIPGSSYDWNTETKVKYLYKLVDVRPVSVPFTPAEGKRHGRVWMEYNGKDYT